MIVCGISGRRRRAAAAIAIDGRLVAAAEQGALTGVAGDGYAGAALPQAAIEACLAAAGLTARDLTHLVRAEGSGVSLTLGASARPGASALPGATFTSHRASRLAAHARLAFAAGAGTALVADGDGAAIVEASGATIDLPRARGLVALLTRLAAALGLPADEPGAALATLELLAASTDADARAWFAALAAAPSDRAAAVDVAAFTAALAAAAADAGAPLDDAATPLVRAARVRAEVAASFLAVLAAHLGAVAASAGADVWLAGGLFASPDFVARVRAAAGRACRVAPCATPEGAAAGAALLAGPLAALPLPDTFELGAPVSEPDAKAVLENCRLDYLYEPRWPRLLERISRVLERGKLVAWVQGPAEFGHPLHGSRSILCDPSSRYARDNINVYLRGRALATPIPVSLPDEARAAVDGAALSPWSLTRATIAAEARDGLRAVTDARGQAHVHVLASGASGPFADLLALHRQRTGVPGLVNLPLAGPDGAAAVSPRDAVRAAFASSVDALVIQRFIVVKDYWQMHTGER